MSRLHNTKPLRSESTDLFEQLDRQTWFIDRMEQHGATGCFGLLSGTLTQAQRRARIRAKVIENGLRTVIIGSRNGKPESYEACFARLFGAPLITKEDEGATDLTPETSGTSTT